MRNSQGYCLTPLDFNFEAYKAFQKSLSVLLDKIANFIFLKLFIMKCIEKDILHILV
jgi:hypothetical protein